MSDKNHSVLGRLSLLGATLIWGSSFIVLKEALHAIPTLWILGIRFAGASVLMSLFCIKKFKQIDRSCLFCGLIMGLALYGGYVLQTFGLVHTTPGKNAFLTSAYCVLVPFLCWIFFKKRPDRYNVAAALLCIVGMAFVCLDGGVSVGLGDGLTLLSGVFYALQIIILSQAVRKYGIAEMSMIQFAVAAMLCLISAPLDKPFPSDVPSSAWLSTAYLTLVCTGLCYAMQAYGQRYTPPQSASIILTLEAVFGTVFSIMLSYERLTLHVGIGFVIIFISIIVSETKLEFLRAVKEPVLDTNS